MSAMTSASPQVLLEFDQISVSYAGKASLFRPVRRVKAVNAVSFQLMQGEVLGIVGESGSGKSTIAKLAMRMLKPDDGEIRYRGKPLSEYRGRDENCLRKEIQMVFQDPNASLNPRLTIEQSLREPFYLHDLGSSIEQHEEITRLLKLVGLPVSVLHRYPHELSGGQKQRVVIARALALQPKVLIADEAVAALDASVKAQIINLLLSLREQLGLTIIFISHDLPLVQIMCDRVLVLYLGQKMELTSRAMIASGGEHPYTRALWASSPVADPARRLQREQLLQGEIPSPLSPPPGCVFHTRCPDAQPVCREKKVAPPLSASVSEVICHFAQGKSV
ncbi:ABC transporter ATP-binding protein [Undibacterium luofuense]|uniref:ABC transporter ATP-binding protein n=1 Tax=Undibacterium luofuense TaxID=2828733 RepID=A0A941I5N6_9BURK|nr:ABC transporter ATP-binding protein [Undibacterium luofuense]MBR7781796.1 ABC transporter ATP-binding protein [Undibacterium luofuense]